MSTSIGPSSFFVTDSVEVDDTEMSIHGKRTVLERLVMGGDKPRRSQQWLEKLGTWSPSV
ncbi:hypothetical protein ASC97_21300 [Rhizobium sp. Root1203]|nr:hypothetical protein ASC97_21300 [Rhizobium sp. Root1203]